MATLAFSALCVAFVLVAPGDALAAPVRSSIAQALILLSGGVIGSYVFGTAWDDRNRRQMERPPE